MPPSVGRAGVLEHAVRGHRGHHRVDVPGPERPVEPLDGRERVAAPRPTEHRQQRGLRVGTRVDRHPVTDHARAAVGVLHRPEPLPDGLDGPGVQRVVLAHRAGQVPGVHEVVRGQLERVLRARRVAEGEVDVAVRRLVDGGQRRGVGLLERPERVVAELIAREAVADVRDRRTGQERWRPQLLLDDVAHQRAHVPAGARRRRVPAVTDAARPGRELVGAQAVELALVHRRSHLA